MNTIANILWQRASSEPDRIAYRFFKGPSLVPATLTFLDLWRRADDFARLLQDNDLAGQRVLLVCKSQMHFVVAFFGCLLSGAVAVPTAPPRRQTLEQRLQLLACNADACAVVTDVAALGRVEVDGRTLPAIDIAAWLARPPDRNASPSDPAHLPSIEPNSLAFLQYTSGSTGDPKGVMVSHANLIHNCLEIQEGMAFGPESSIFTALPLFHDMGLVGGVLESMFAGCVGNCMEPAEFVQYPERWFHIVSAFGITISGGPNFMYDLAVRNVQPAHLEGVDLSRWSVAFCGAEPIRAATLERFTEKFSAWGFRPQAFYPCYGMAEATLFITGKPLDTVPSVATFPGSRVVGCGMTRHSAQIQIVDPESLRPLPEGQTGEIWVSGPSVAQGYWRNDVQTVQSFQAVLAEQADTHFLRTGDLGFVSRGELYICGRLKDLIIFNGRKLAPQDLETTATDSHEALSAGATVAFSLPEDGRDRVILVCELKREWLRRSAAWPDVIAAVRNAVTATHGLTPDDIVFIRPGALLRTSSGKVRRLQCRLDYQAGTLADARLAEPA